jgi:hypothetical protein
MLASKQKLMAMRRSSRFFNPCSGASHASGRTLILIRFAQKAKKGDLRFQEQEMEKKKSGKNPWWLASLSFATCQRRTESAQH